jgi:ankyrin repeat protein
MTPSQQALLDAIELGEAQAAASLAQSVDLLAPINAQGATLLTTAIGLGNVEMVKVLIENCPAGSLERVGSISALSAAAALKDEDLSLTMIRLTLERCDPRLARVFGYGSKTPIMAAAQLGHARAIEILGQAVAPWECAGLMDTPMSCAAEAQSPKAIRALLAFGRPEEQCQPPCHKAPSPLGIVCMLESDHTAECARLLAPTSSHVSVNGESAPAVLAATHARPDALEAVLPWAPYPCLDDRGRSLLEIAQDQNKKRPYVEYVEKCLALVQRWTTAHQERLALEALAQAAPASRLGTPRI